MINNNISRNDVQTIKVFEGVYRKTLLYNKDLMLCHFTLEKNANIPIHTHKEHQIGYIIQGKLKFLMEDREFIVKKGDSYVFDSNEKHGATVLEYSEVIDVFNPAREDYK